MGRDSSDRDDPVSCDISDILNGEIWLTGVARQSLQASVQRVHTYVQSLEEKLGELERKKK